MWWAALAVATNLYGAKRAKDAAKGASANSQAAIEATSEEKIRRFTLEHERDIGSAWALAASSGVGVVRDTVSGGFDTSPGGLVQTTGYTKVIEEMQSEFQKEVDWMRRAASMGIDSVQSDLKSAKTEIDYRSLNSLLGIVGDVGKTKGWWS